MHPPCRWYVSSTVFKLLIRLCRTLCALDAAQYHLTPPGLVASLYALVPFMPLIHFITVNSVDALRILLAAQRTSIRSLTVERIANFSKTWTRFIKAGGTLPATLCSLKVHWMRLYDVEGIRQLGTLISPLRQLTSLEVSRKKKQIVPRLKKYPDKRDWLGGF